MAAGRTLHVRCTTWEQVEAFYTRKLRHGKLLSMKVPFDIAAGAQVTLGLELPNQMVVAIDGAVQKASRIEGEGKGGRVWIEVALHGFTDEVLARIKALGRARAAAPTTPASPSPLRKPPPAAPAPRADLPAGERELFQHLTAELRRLRQVAVHEVLGVGADADADAVRRAWMELVRRHHPDLVARHHAPAITHLAEELTILCNRAYDELRARLVAGGRATAVGSAISEPAGWLVGFEDVSSRAPVHEPPIAVPPPPRAAAPAPPPPLSASQGGETFETRARAMLGDGDADNAQEVLAAALCVYPRSRPLRSLYYVAAAMAALTKGELMLATSQLEAALAHHEQCREAAAMLEHLRKHNGERLEDMRGLFR